MQLIITQPTTEVINIKMSTQIENSVNGIIDEIKQDLNQTITTNEESLTTNIEKTLSNELPVSETLKHIENNMVNNDGVTNCALEGITQNEEKHDAAPQITTNGVNDVNEVTNDSACEMGNLNKDIIIDVCQSSSNNVNFLEENVDKSNIATESASENNKKSSNIALNVETPLNITKIDKSNADEYKKDDNISNLLDVTDNDDKAKDLNDDMTTNTIDDIQLDDVIMEKEVNKSSKHTVHAVNTKESNFDSEMNSLELTNEEDIIMEDSKEIDSVKKMSDIVNSELVEKNEVLLPAQSNNCVDVNETSDLSLNIYDEESMKLVLEDSQDKILEDNCDIMDETNGTTTKSSERIDETQNQDTNQDNDMTFDNTSTILEENEPIKTINEQHESMEIDNDAEDKNTEDSNEKGKTNLNERDTIVVDITEVIDEVEGKETKSEDASVTFNEVEDKTKSEITREQRGLENIVTSENVMNSDSTNNLIEKSAKELADTNESVEIIDEDDVKIVEDNTNEKTSEISLKENSSESQKTTCLPVVCKLSNTLDILSDDEEETLNEVPKPCSTNKSEDTAEEKQCINIDDDDDIMLIEEDSNSKDKPKESNNKTETESKLSNKIDEETGEKNTTDITDLMPKVKDKEPSSEDISSLEPETEEKVENKSTEEAEKKPLLPQNFLKTAKKNLSSMTRHELEDFCILRIVESIVDRSNLSDIKTKMKTMSQTLEDYKKRVMQMLKQNRDLQVVLKSVQEEQKKQTNVPIQPLKITRSVGMQVLVNEKMDPRRKMPIPNTVQPPPLTPSGRPVRAVQPAKQIKTPPVTPTSIPVPRKVPVNNSPAKTLVNTTTNNVITKSASPNANGLKNLSPVQKGPEKRPHCRLQTSSVTVDLTDDEPPPKISSKNSPPVRVVPPQNLLAQQRQFPPINNARKVYIPISGPQAQQLRPGQTIVMKSPNTGPRPAGLRQPITTRPQQQIRPKQTASRHPAPLPESMKQYTPPTWKALPPAPDLKLTKVDNGIVISWKIDGYPDGDYETIASYQLYAYQETSAPPCTALWKKIGDVKALPLPMACTLTQFMAGFKYYFAVRAVDIRSRLGPFSLPGSILLINKM